MKMDLREIQLNKFKEILILLFLKKKKKTS